ncbi:MAG: PAS domain S-box protein [Planctomycetota bacterium]
MTASTMATACSDPEVARRSDEIFRTQAGAIYKRTDRLFAGLMMLQWGAAIVVALLISPRSWDGLSSQVHAHVWAAVLVGGAIAWGPVLLALKQPAEASTRYVIAAGQMLMSALLIHLWGGRIETHFHVFGSLAFLSFYRDWRVFIPATTVVALDHLLRGLFWPESVFGTAVVSQWRWAEHAAWVLFESVFLVRACQHGATDLREMAKRQAQLEGTNRLIEARVEEQTAEIAQRESLFRSLADSSPLGIFRTEGASTAFTFANEQCRTLLGVADHEPIVGWWPLMHAEDRHRVEHSWDLLLSDGVEFDEVFRIDPQGGASRWVHARARPVSGTAGFAGTIEDITESRDADVRLTALGRTLEESGHEIYVVDAETLAIKHLNRGIRQRTGYSTKGAVPSLIDLQPELSEEEFLALVAPLSTGAEQVISHETLHRRADGSTYPVLVRIQRASLSGEAVFIVVAIETTQQKAADAHHARLTAAIEHAPDGVVIWEPSGTIRGSE